MEHRWHPWSAVYSSATDEYLVPDDVSMLDVFRTTVADHHRRPAYRYFDRSRTFGDLDGDSDALAAWFQRHGVGVGNRVAIVMQNVPGFLIAVLATWKAGAIPVTINPMYRAAELSRLFADAAPSIVICQDTDYEEVVAGLSSHDRNAPEIVLVSPRDGQAENPPLLPESREWPDTIRLADILIEGAGASPLPVEKPSPTGLILYTSGTTGTPKGAMIPHRALVFNANFMRRWCRLGTDDGNLAIAPLFHITGFVCNMCASFSAGGPLVLPYRFEPNEIARLVRRWRPTFTIGAITAFNALMRAPGVTADDLSSLSTVFSGGAPIPAALKREVDAALGISIHPCYGMTETAAPAVFTPLGTPAPVRDGVLSIGVPIPGTDVEIVDEAGAATGPDHAGEILMRGPNIMTGYWQKPDETAATLRDGWMHSGDVAVMDEAGWLYIVDRKKDVIVASGFKVWPREVEDVLYEHPAVREAAVVGVADAYRGESVMAVVALTAGSPVSADVLEAHCRARLAAYKVPRRIDILDELPKTVTGKIQRAALRPSTR